MRGAGTDEEWLEGWHKAWEAGSFPAIIETIMFCRQFQLVLPNWASSALIEKLHAEYFAAEGRRTGGKQGRDGSLKGRETARHRDYARYLRVRNRLGREGLLPREFWTKKDENGSLICPSVSGAYSPRELEIMVFKYVSESLRSGPHNFAFGTWRRVEASYRKVKVAIEMGEGAEYFVAGLGK